ncbi:hypothetical protein METBIDRAFT_35160 [Metschnikowia bicuspidata var. bicuspidata NRRL YB-4993]|uniref:SET domain-containing protein n=1 Tax=Metschnikowia bicuspidata var. bicuspidata NRRL YB-4993 TaxID=869754 RepID=A0A1A0HHF0_9ASCO|nr:hypothetical protein METBIDRAFT_35160 [Metschnikowia bicuspidata var. bicuspidata NRRL YB-4993]OBA23302.1 hypothetical protein METBIDRAFT_35160 [Metschnikowia bicuspidata var. bicuspidata NRRL YB-4993]
MSATESARMQGLQTWLAENASWNFSLLEIKPSQRGGMGVFFRLDTDTEPGKRGILLRIPKSHVLSPKNSFIYSLLVDHTSSNVAIGLSTGMHALVLAYIYEMDLGEESPWHLYLLSFSAENSPIPLCLWEDTEKQAFFNTECDLLDMLDSSELIALYIECSTFAQNNKDVVHIPAVFESPTPNPENLKLFGRCVQTVVSRAFYVDKFHGLSLVPGADLFNHISPIDLGKIVEERENVHFTCDDNVCETCGETECAHMDFESDDEDVEDMDDMKDEENAQGDGDQESEDENADIEVKENQFAAALVDEDMNVEESEASQTESENERDPSDTEIMDDHIFENEGIDEDKPITMEDIENLEEISDAETIQDDDEASTVSSIEEDARDDETRVDPTASQVELAEELQNRSKCCDVILMHLPDRLYDFEVFNTYGNELLNLFLLQRYGFVTVKNPNTSCLLLVQMLRDLKKFKKTARGEQQLDMKILWYESCGFEIVNQICVKRATEINSDDDQGGKDSCEAGCIDDCCDEPETEEVPESWQLSPKITADAVPSPQTLAILRLITMSYNIFYSKLRRSPSERKLEKRIAKYLLQEEISPSEKSVLKRWIQERLDRYKPIGEVPDDKREIIETIHLDEKKLLIKALAALS